MINFVEGLENIVNYNVLIHFMSLVSFYIPFCYFQGYRKRPVAWNGFKYTRKSNAKWKKALPFKTAYTALSLGENRILSD